jgi:hypothetical protein
MRNPVLGCEGSFADADRFSRLGPFCELGPFCRFHERSLDVELFTKSTASALRSVSFGVLAIVQAVKDRCGGCLRRTCPSTWPYAFRPSLAFEAGPATERSEDSPNESEGSLAPPPLHEVPSLAPLPRFLRNFPCPNSARRIDKMVRVNKLARFSKLHLAHKISPSTNRFVAEKWVCRRDTLSACSQNAFRLQKTF